MGSSQISNIGNILNVSRNAYSHQWNNIKNLLLKLNLFGDPSVHLWHSCPDIITRADGSLALEKFNYSNNYYVIIYDVNNNTTANYPINNSNELINNLIKDFDGKIVTIVSPNSIPVILPFSVSNIKFQGDRYLVCNDVRFGTNNNSTVEFDSSCNYTINAYGNVSFENGAKCKTNSNLTVTSQKEVTFNNTYIESKAHLSIAAKKIVLGSGTIISSETKLSVINNQ